MSSSRQMEARLRYVIPLTLVLVVVLLYLSLRGWPQTFLVLSSLPFAVAGSVWLLAFMHYNLSTAVWVGLIAVAGVAAETGIVMVVYLDEAYNGTWMRAASRNRKTWMQPSSRARARECGRCDDGRHHRAGFAAVAMGGRRRRRHVGAHGSAGGWRPVVLHAADAAGAASRVRHVAPTSSARGCRNVIASRSVKRRTRSSRASDVSVLTSQSPSVLHLEAEDAFSSIVAVGHRIVHGLARTEPARITPEVSTASSRGFTRSCPGIGKNSPVLLTASPDSDSRCKRQI